MLKKLLLVVLGAVFALSSFSACKNTDDRTSFSFYAPDGAPALSIAKFIEDEEDFDSEKTFDYNIVSASDIGGYINGAKEYSDFIILPVTAASKLYNKNADDAYKMLAVVTHGNLYVMSTEELTLNDLKDRKVGIIGRGLVPDLTFKALLSDNDIQYSETETSGKVQLTYYSQATELIAALKQGVLSVGLLPEPAATNLTKNVSEKTWFTLDVQKLYDEERKSFPQAVLMAKTSVIETYPKIIEKLSEKFDENSTWVKENLTKAVENVNSALAEGLTASLSAAALTVEAVQGCNIYYEKANEAKDSVKEYIDKILTVGAELEAAPAKAITDDFFAE